MAAYCAGISAVIFSSSGRLAGRIFSTRLVFPAPLTLHGLAASFPWLAAVPRMVRSRP